LSAIIIEIQTLLKQTNFWCQNSQKVMPCRHFGGPCPLASSVKAEQIDFGSPPIKLLESLVHSTDDRSVKQCFFKGQISPDGEFFSKTLILATFFSKTHFLIPKIFIQIDLFHPN
jgi:hypothetical protein